MKVNYAKLSLLIIFMSLSQALGYKLPTCNIKHGGIFGSKNQKFVSLLASNIKVYESSEPVMITIDSYGKVGVFRNPWSGFDDQIPPSCLKLSSEFSYPVTRSMKRNNIWIDGSPISSSTAVLDKYGKEELYFTLPRGDFKPHKEYYSYLTLDQFPMMGLVGGDNHMSPICWCANFANDNLYCMDNNTRGFVPVTKEWKSFGRMVGLSTLERSNSIAIATEDVKHKTYKLILYQPQFNGKNVDVKQTNSFDFGYDKIRYIVFGLNAFGFAICNDGELYVIQTHYSHNFKPQRIFSPDERDISSKCLQIRYIYGNERSAFIVTLEKYSHPKSNEHGDENHQRLVVYHIATNSRSNNGFTIRTMHTYLLSFKGNVISFDIIRVPTPRGHNARNIHAVAAILLDNTDLAVSQDDRGHMRDRDECKNCKREYDSHKSLIEHVKIEINLHRV